MVKRISSYVKNLVAPVQVVDEYTLAPGDFALYTAPSGLRWTVCIDQIDDEYDMAFIAYYLENGLEMTGWVMLSDLQFGVGVL